MQLACSHFRSCISSRHAAKTRRSRCGPPRVTADRPSSALPQVQILERAAESASRPSEPLKAQTVAQFLDEELRQLFRTGVSSLGALLCNACMRHSQLLCGSTLLQDASDAAGVAWHGVMVPFLVQRSGHKNCCSHDMHGHTCHKEPHTRQCCLCHCPNSPMHDATRAVTLSCVGA
jgi:hypothetical protein